MKIKLALPLVLLLFSPMAATAQFWEIGILGGITEYQGDLHNTGIPLSFARPAGTALVRANFHRHFTLKGSITYGSLAGDDARARYEEERSRNLHFRSNLLEFNMHGELNFFKGYQIGRKKDRTALYGFFGASLFRFDPKASLEVDGEEEWVRLQPLGTEGQETPRFNERRKYALTQFAIPFGLGIKSNIGGNWTFNLEFGPRKTFTDYIDDVSTTYVDYDYLRRQNGELAARLSNRSAEYYGSLREYPSGHPRGNPSNLDWYYHIGAGLTYTFTPGLCPTWK